MHPFRLGRDDAGLDLNVLALQEVAGSHNSCAQGDCHLRTDPEPQMILSQRTRSEGGWRLSKPGKDLGAGHRQTLSSADTHAETQR